jgi:hypothetical protein
MIGMTRRPGHVRPPEDRRFGGGALVVALLLLGTLSCGNNGDVSVTVPNQPEPQIGAIQGTVFAPNGQVASNHPWLQRLNPLDLLPAAYAALNPNVIPVGPGVLVAFTRLSEVDAADGSIDSPVLIEQGLTNRDGIYRILDHAADNVDVCRLMVAVGGGELLMRSFVTTTVADIDVASEATVRVVLNRLTQAPPAHLCDFSTEELIQLQNIVANATFTANGTDVSEINRDAYALARDNICVQDALQKATDNDFDGTPSQCLRFYQ